MKKTANHPLGTAGLMLCLVALFQPLADAEQVFKCVEGGKTRFTSFASEGQGCQAIDLKVPQPNPVDAARQTVQNQEYARAEKLKADKKREEKRIDSEAQRRAINAKLAEAIARSPLPKLPNSGGKKKGNSQ